MPGPAMASTALLLFLLLATSNSVGAVKVSPPSLHEGGNDTQTTSGNVSWFPAASFTDPCNITEPPDDVVIGPPDDMVCDGVRKVTVWFLGRKLLLQAEPDERICVCVSNIGPPGSGYHRLSHHPLNIKYIWLITNVVQALWNLSRSLCFALPHGGAR